MKILLIQLKRIGDLILTTPTIAALRSKFPDAQIDLAVSRGCEELLPAIPGIDRGLVVRGKWSSVTNWLKLTGRRYDYCLDFTRNDRSALLTFFSGAKKRITWEHTRMPSKWRSLVYNEFTDSSVSVLHTVDHHLAFLAPLGIEGASGEINLDLPATARSEADTILRAAGVESPIVIFHPGSARKEKFWDAKRWAKVIDHCGSKRRIRCVLTGGTATMEREHLAQIKAHARHPVIDLSGKFNLLALAAMIDQAQLLVTVDSAPAHLAAATHTPQVVLYGPTNPFHWRPRHSPAVIIQAGVPSPLTDFSPKQPRAAMNEISTEAVIDAMESLLSAPAASAI